ncbi:MAG: ABC transporter substrate-binding protein, partial [Albidovulum sp.]
MRRPWLATLCLIFVGAAGDTATGDSAATVLRTTYLRLEEERPPVLSNLEPVPEDEGIAGVELAHKDNASTGKFLGHEYILDVVSLPPGSDPLPAAREALAAAPFLILDADADTVTAVADLPEAQGALILSVAAADERLRDADCRANVLHTGLSYSMRADALMQALMAKRWTRLVLITGPNPVDLAWAAALKAAAAKFGLQILAEKAWTEKADLRRTASAEVPLFTQDLPEHDVLVVADETDDFARYIAYNTWLPRPG